MTIDGQQALHLSVTETHPLLPLRQESPLPPYDPDGKCPKCASDHVDTHYHDGLETWSTCYPFYLENEKALGGTMPEHLDRRCTRCDFKWPEAVADV